MNKEEILFFILAASSVVLLAHLIFLKKTQEKEESPNKKSIQSPLMSRYFIGEMSILERDFSRVKTPKQKQQKSNFLQRFSKAPKRISTPRNTPENKPIPIPVIHPLKWKGEIEPIALPPPTEQAPESVHCLTIQRSNGFSMFNVKR